VHISLRTAPAAAEPPTQENPRRGYATGSAGLATLVRGSSRRIMIMRFRPAHIRLINRRFHLTRLPLALSSKTLNHHPLSTEVDRVTPYQPLRHCFPARRPIATNHYFQSSISLHSEDRVSVTYGTASALRSNLRNDNRRLKKSLSAARSDSGALYPVIRRFRQAAASRRQLPDRRLPVVSA
jgi:hypothetical protein